MERLKKRLERRELTVAKPRPFPRFRHAESVPKGEASNDAKRDTEALDCSGHVL